MKTSHILQWAADHSFASYRAGVSLHSHTLHSKESLDFINHAARHSALLRAVLRHGNAKYQAFHGVPLNFSKGWWTPPLAPLDAVTVETDQIKSLGLSAIVSLTDHDNIDAPMSLQAISPTRQVPISVEWTVPFRQTFFHLGIHNLLAPRARIIMDRLAAFTANPVESGLGEILADVHKNAGSLIVFNHPLWDEAGIGSDLHTATVLEFLKSFRQFVDAFELNGLRPWSENRRVVSLAEVWSKPVISGGDRHILEPNAILNLTNARDFAEFAAEVRTGFSELLIMPQYRAPYSVRIYTNLLDTFRTYESHGMGWTEWADRVFYEQPDGNVSSLSELWGNNPPLAVSAFAGFMRLSGQARLKSALQAGLWRREEMTF